MAKRQIGLALPSLEGFHRYFDVQECLMFMGRELGRLRIEEHHLLPYQYEILRDLRGGIDEQAMAEMLNYWEFDLDLLFSRGNRNTGRPRPAKPRIDVQLEITSKGNLKAEWFPRGWSIWGPPTRDTVGCDFRGWMRVENRNYSFDSRPSNELLFVHKIRSAAYTLQSTRRDSPLQIYDHVLLRGCQALVEHLEGRLDYHFDVRMLHSVFVEWHEPPGEPGSWRSGPPTLTSWTLEDPAERERLAALEELEDMEARYGFSREQLEAANAAELERKATGPAPAPHTMPARISKRLKKQGLSATPGKVERALALIEKCDTAHRLGVAR